MCRLKPYSRLLKCNSAMFSELLVSQEGFDLWRSPRRSPRFRSTLELETTRGMHCLSQTILRNEAFPCRVLGTGETLNYYFQGIRRFVGEIETPRHPLLRSSRLIHGSYGKNDM